MSWKWGWVGPKNSKKSTVVLIDFSAVLWFHSWSWSLELVSIPADAKAIVVWKMVDLYTSEIKPLFCDNHIPGKFLKILQPKIHLFFFVKLQLVNLMKFRNDFQMCLPFKVDKCTSIRNIAFFIGLTKKGRISLPQEPFTSQCRVPWRKQNLFLSFHPTNISRLCLNGTLVTTSGRCHVWSGFFTAPAEKHKRDNKKNLTWINSNFGYKTSCYSNWKPHKMCGMPVELRAHRFQHHPSTSRCPQRCKVWTRSHHKGVNALRAHPANVEGFCPKTNVSYTKELGNAQLYQHLKRSIKQGKMWKRPNHKRNMARRWWLWPGQSHCRNRGVFFSGNVEEEWSCWCQFTLF